VPAFGLLCRRGNALSIKQLARIATQTSNAATRSTESRLSVDGLTCDLAASSRAHTIELPDARCAEDELVW
jgi:hypothetical protein